MEGCWQWPTTYFASILFCLKTAACKIHKTYISSMNDVMPRVLAFTIKHFVLKKKNWLQQAESLEEMTVLSGNLHSFFLLVIATLREGGTVYPCQLRTLGLETNPGNRGSDPGRSIRRWGQEVTKGGPSQQHVGTLSRGRKLINAQIWLHLFYISH